jgi:ribosome-dependent ATPase
LTDTSDPIASLNGLWHRYGKQVALRGVSLELRRGGMIGLIGPDGVGKSTLLGILAGAKKVQSGQVRLFGGDFTKARHRNSVCHRIAYMPQGLGRNLYPDLTVSENIAFFSRLFGQGGYERERRTVELLDATGMAPFRNRPAGKLSGGMRQKLGLCCALIHDPDLLILDEPTTGVDPLSRRQFWDLVDTIRAGRPEMSVIVATAYMDEANRFAHLLAMNDGNVLASGTPAELEKRTGCDTLDESFIALLPEAVKATRVRPNIGLLDIEHADTAISAVGLTRRFGDFVAVDNVSFDIKQGEIFGFLGSNGCGKTTTMKMLTGLLPVTAGKALVFGRQVDASDKSIRYRVGYMSQLFSLYTELTARQNLALHARLYHIPPEKAGPRIAELVADFTLGNHLDDLAADLPLGIRQRLALAVAVINQPEVLLLDEPTSGVDPLARDQFWALLGTLSRKDHVTIFISTHFMNEAALCDRISLMNAGRVLITGSPAEVIQKWGGPDPSQSTLEDAFIACLGDATGQDRAAPAGKQPTSESERAASQAPKPRKPQRRFSLQRMLAYSRRETLELRRDPIRLAFSVLGTAFLMLVLGYGVNTDVDHLPFAVYDQDQTPESRVYLNEYRGSIYFTERAPITSEDMLHQRLDSGELMLALEIPAGFGRDVRRDLPADASAWVDGAMPFRAQTTQGYLVALQQIYLADLALSQGHPPALTAPAGIRPRYRYNQTFESVNAMVPANIALLLALVPAILMALAVVREKEFGSITNLYVTPVSRSEFALGKQLPYVVLAMTSFVIITIMAVLLFGVPIKGNLAALAVGTLIYVFATTGYGLLVSSFSSTQIAALFGTAILTIVPATQFSGMNSPVSSLVGAGAIISHLFPMTYYLPISVGAFTKSLGFTALYRTMLYLAIFAPLLLVASVTMLRKQDR